MARQSDEKVVLFGSGKIGLRVFERIGSKIVAVIDNNPEKWGKKFMQDIPIISMEEYLKKYKIFPIIIASIYAKEMEEQLKRNEIYNYMEA